eukprot:4043350-Amphidinium_carterae.1
MNGGRIHDLHDFLSPRCWWLVYQTNMRMRGEKFDRIRRRLESTHQLMLEVGTADRRTNEQIYNKDHPWDTVMRVASNDQSATTFWSNAVVTKGQLYLTSVKSELALKDEGGERGRQKKTVRGDDGNYVTNLVAASVAHHSSVGKTRTQGKGVLSLGWAQENTTTLQRPG